MAELASGHDHALEGPVVIVHSGATITPEGLTQTRAHAFGPFLSEDEARMFDRMAPDDDCAKVIMALVEPFPPLPLFATKRRR